MRCRFTGDDIYSSCPLNSNCSSSNHGQLIEYAENDYYHPRNSYLYSYNCNRAPRLIDGALVVRGDLFVEGDIIGQRDAFISGNDYDNSYTVIEKIKNLQYEVELLKQNNGQVNSVENSGTILQPSNIDVTVIESLINNSSEIREAIQILKGEVDSNKGEVADIRNKCHNVHERASIIEEENKALKDSILLLKSSIDGLNNIINDNQKIIEYLCKRFSVSLNNIDEEIVKLDKRSDAAKRLDAVNF